MSEIIWASALSELKAFSGKMHLGIPAVGTSVGSHDLIVLPQWTPITLLKLARFFPAQVALVNPTPLSEDLLPFYDWVFPELKRWPEDQTSAEAPAVKKDVGEKKIPALILDRDGVVNVDHGYVGKVEMVELIPGVSQLVHAANQKNRKVIIATNQSGIARGYYSVDDFKKVMEKITSLLDQDRARVDHVEKAMYHPNSAIDAFRWGRQFRKPRPGMIHQAAQKLGLDLSASILVGDKANDLKCAVLAGVGRVHLFKSENVEAEWNDFQSWIEKLKKDFSLSQLLQGISVSKIDQLDEVKEL